jgi:hypothetical protein
VKNIFFPEISLSLLPRILVCAAVGAIIAGCYGIIHDQITYNIGEEYFTKLKFKQFSYADFGFPRRVFVSEIGFLATWWVGLFGGWFIGRVAIPRLTGEELVRRCRNAFAIMFAFAALGTSCGYLLGLMHGPDYSGWQPIAFQLGVEDVRNFVRVAYIHNCSYVGGLVGLVAAIIYVRRAVQNTVNSSYTAASDFTGP